MYEHRYEKDKQADHPVDPITTGWAPGFMTCRTCGKAIIQIVERHEHGKMTVETVMASDEEPK